MIVKLPVVTRGPLELHSLAGLVVAQNPLGAAVNKNICFNTVCPFLGYTDVVYTDGPGGGS
jgi:hypothetical protein